MCTGWGLQGSVCSRGSMVEERYHATTQHRFYRDMSNVNKKYYSGGKTYQPTYVKEANTIKQILNNNKYDPSRLNNLTPLTNNTKTDLNKTK